MSDTLHLTGAGLSVERLVAAATGKHAITLAPDGLSRMAKTHAFVTTAIENKTPVYGVTTGLGARATEVLDAQTLSAFSTQTVRGRAHASGKMLPSDVTRAAVITRVNTLLSGCAAARPEVAAHMVACLNAGLIPVVGEIGSVGVADLLTNGSVGLAFIGEGDMQGDEGTVGPSAKMMQAKGIAPLDLAPRDGLSMISHSGPSVALAAFAVYETGVAYEALQTCAALSMEGFRANVGPMDPDVLAVKPHPGQAAAAAGLRHALDGSALWAEGAARRLQDPLSFRNIVHIHGPLHTALDAARDCVLIELNGSSDNPVALIDRAALVSNGAYLAGEIAVMMDYVARAAVPVAMASLARIAKLLNPVFTDLPPFLAMPGSTSNGLAPLTKSAEALVARIVQAAQPTPVWPSVSANGVEDVLTNAPLSAASLRTIAADLVHLAALEALTACQAIDLRGVAPDLGPTLRDTHQAIRAVSDVVTEDRPLSRDINQLTALLRKRSR